MDENITITETTPADLNRLSGDFTKKDRALALRRRLSLIVPIALGAVVGVGLVVAGSVALNHDNPVD